jgi:regulator of replication initiation timing
MFLVLVVGNTGGVFFFLCCCWWLVILLQKMDATWTENTALREAYHASMEETAALKAAVDTLRKKLDENIATTTPPSPETATSSSAMEEMTMQLSHVQHDI